MSNNGKKMVTLADSPYEILELPFDATGKDVIKAMRSLFRKDRKRANKGNLAQKKLSQSKERVKQDALCAEVEARLTGLSSLADEIQPQTPYCRLFDDPLMLSDLKWPGGTVQHEELKVQFKPLAYRKPHDQ